MNRIRTEEEQRWIRARDLFLDLGEVRLRLIDFGIATAISRADREGSTQASGALYTPRYASPEQRAGSEDIDTRCDVYAQGCVPCEMLAGKTPRTTIGSDETNATPPSALSEVNTQGVIAARWLTGELDCIVMTCVAWDKDRRYGSAAALADDLERYLQSGPIHSTPPRSAYIVRKFEQRHWLGVGGGGGWLL